MRFFAMFGLLGALALGLGCAANVDEGSAAQLEQELQGGCHAVCPKCPANKICPMMACYEVCNGKAKQCVQTQACVQGAQWDSKACACIATGPTPGTCATDADCRTFADYCTGCNCLALSSSEPDPTCSGPGVRCLADPCGAQTAACVSGNCSLQ